MFVELLCGLLAFLAIWDILNKRRRYQMLQAAGIPGPMPLPILGNLLMAVGYDPSNIFDLFAKMRQRYGKVYSLWMVNECILFVQDAKFLEGFLKSPQVLTKNMIYDLLHSWLGEGLLLSKGPKWFARRRIITPTFHFKILEEFVEIFDQQSHVLVKRLREKADGKTVVNMFPEICLMALDIIAETAMGVKIHAQEHPELPYSKAVRDTAKIVAIRSTKPFDRFDWYFRLFSNKSYHHLNQCTKIMHDFANQVIEERRNALKKSIDEGTYKPQDNAANEFGIKKRTAFLDVLLQATVDGKPLSNQDIREEVDTLMFAGHDTTTSGISYTCYLLSRHPEVQKKLFEEIRDVIGDDRDKSITMQQLHDLKYLECVIKESLRFYPPVPIIGRITEQDVVINDVTIPANTNLSLLIYAVCRDSDYFPSPQEFLPERFWDSGHKINPFAYIPFSAGQRNCVGQKFALLEMKSTISKLMRHFELLPLGEDVKPEINLILRSLTGINVGLKPRIYT